MPKARTMRLAPHGQLLFAVPVNHWQSKCRSAKNKRNEFVGTFACSHLPKVIHILDDNKPQQQFISPKYNIYNLKIWSSLQMV